MCEVSEIFEAAYWRLSAKVDPLGLEELLRNFQELAERDPALAGYPHPYLENALVFEGPSLVRLPRIMFVFSVDEVAGVVRLWNCRLL